MRRTPVPASVLVLLGGSALLAGCPAPPNGLARAQQTAQEYNLDARFGRTELAMAHVDPAVRDEFALHHRAWGTGVRVADVELAGMKAQGEHDVDVFVRVAWYRPEQEELRTTTLQQRWHDKDGWQLMSEKRLDGDVGLLGEAVVFETPSAPRAPAQFPTIRLGGGSAEE
ncbi:MAG TPA: hypothetical protein VIF15_18325 [Polyangiaceae bacterium]|jgi:hypothetical protein